MGFIFKGVGLKGFAIETAENFNSIPGLYLYVDSFLRVTASGGIVQSILDGSNNGFNFTVPSAFILPINYADNVITQDNSTAGLESGFLNKQGDWGFLEDGSPFSIFGYQKIDFGTTGNVRDIGILGEIDGIFTSSLIHIRNNKSLRFQLRDETTNNSLLSVSSPSNSIVENEPYTYGVVRRELSGTNNFQLYINNVATNATNANTQTPSATRVNCRINNFTAAENHRIDWGFKVVYNWTGYSLTEINNFTDKLRILVENRKNAFTL